MSRWRVAADPPVKEPGAIAIAIIIAMIFLRDQLSNQFLDDREQPHVEMRAAASLPVAPF